MLTAIAAALTVCFLIVIGLMLTAPEGFEDERGWHAGPEQPLDPAQDGGKPDARRVTRADVLLHDAASAEKGPRDHV